MYAKITQQKNIILHCETLERGNKAKLGDFNKMQSELLQGMNYEDIEYNNTILPIAPIRL